MPAKVFISCGQKTDEERRTARRVAELFSAAGFEPYAAIEVQTITELNASIITELKNSDYFVFINFRREMIWPNTDRPYRGSLFTNQELSIAYALGFDHMILLNESGVRREGVHEFIVANAPEFRRHDEIESILAAAIKQWSKDYSRQLHLADLRWSRDVEYDDGFSGIVSAIAPEKPLFKRRQRMLLAKIRNSRSGKSAANTIARLKSIQKEGTPPIPAPDRSPLKASGINGYSHIIWPDSDENFDLFAIHLDCPREVFLNSAHDFRSRHPIISQVGRYELDYEVFSEGFPLLGFRIHLDVNERADDTLARSDNGLLAHQDELIASGQNLGPW
jgi:hypothetical protein